VRSMRLEGESRENEHAVGVNAPESSWPLFAMGREICNPMNSIISMTSILLRDETLTSDQREFVESIKVSSDALMRVLNDIIDLSKLESEKLTLNIHPFSLRSLVEETLSSISIDAARKGLVLSHRFNGAVPDDILQDKMRLEQVIFNLLDSAVKCTDSGEIRLNISCQGGQGDLEIHFSILDTGLDLSREGAEDLFNPLIEKDSLCSYRSGRSGLGLAICKGLVELMEGRIWVEYAEGTGSAFHFTIKANPRAEVRKLCGEN
jgi:signal transduction histidine kinase